MKRIILVITCISGFLIPSFSQLNNFKIDTTFRKLAIEDYPLAFNPEIAADYKNQIFGSSDRFFSKKQDYTLDSFLNSAEVQSYNMPCVKSQGFFPMSVYKPDSTVRYSLKVEKIK